MGIDDHIFQFGSLCQQPTPNWKIWSSMPMKSAGGRS
jgi:hypothetical protein